MRLIRIGYWSDGDKTTWPDVQGFVDADWDEDERLDAVYYLRLGVLVRAYMGLSRCRMCGKSNGSVELSDLVYVWPEGLAHYVSEHNVRPSAEFMDHVKARTDLMDDAEIDDTWWRGFRR